MVLILSSICKFSFLFLSTCAGNENEIKKWNYKMKRNSKNGNTKRNIFF